MSQTLADPPVLPAAEPAADLPGAWRRRWDRAWASERFWAWAGPLIVTAIGGLPRFWHLATPHKMIFDETYYVKEGVSYLKYGVEMTLKETLTTDASKRNDMADRLLAGGSTDIFSTQPDRVVHPMVGKWMIAFGEWLFGPTSSFGWRFSAALCGTLSILILGRVAYRLFGSALLGTVAALLLAVDGQEFVHSRTSILDIFVMFWALAAFACLLTDRDRARARLARLTQARAGTEVSAGVRTGFGPWLGLRPWRVTAIVCLALCTGVKWSGIYFAAAFLTLSVLWDLGARRAAGVRRPLLATTLRDGVQAAVTFVVLYPTVYVATWATWFLTDNGWNRQWAVTNPADPGWGWVPGALRSLWHYHAETWQFHLNLTSPHDWQANPWTWLILGRPTLFFFDTHKQGHAGCQVEVCRQMMTDLGNPLIWWGAVLAVGVLAFRWVLARDWRAGAVLAGLVGGYLPWFLYQQRTIFQFYAVAFVPWVVLAVTYCLGLVLGPRDAPPQGRRVRVGLVGGYVLLALTFFWFFYPVLAARIVPQSTIDLRDWFPSWY